MPKKRSADTGLERLAARIVRLPLPAQLILAAQLFEEAHDAVSRDLAISIAEGAVNEYRASQLLS